MLKVYENLYQHSIYRDDINISDHQYLLDCAMPTLVHAGSHDAALDMLPQLEKILGARSLSYILISHLGADECGGLDAILNRYPKELDIV